MALKEQENVLLTRSKWGSVFESISYPITAKVGQFGHTICKPQNNHRKRPLPRKNGLKLLSTAGGVNSLTVISKVFQAQAMGASAHSKAFRMGHRVGPKAILATHLAGRIRVIKLRISIGRRPSGRNVAATFSAFFCLSLTSGINFCSYRSNAVG